MFTTSTGAHTIKFAGTNPLGGDHTAFIDNVRISGTPRPGYGLEWLVTDQLGTPRMVVDESGAIANVKRHDYLPFDEELLSQGLRNSSGSGYASTDGLRQQFTSKERDVETGLDYFIARYYSATQGRFISADELVSGSNPIAYADLTYSQSLNKYSYVNNNPLSTTDPDGHCPENKPCPPMTYEKVEDEQRRFCEEQKQPYVAADAELKVGFALETRGRLPLNGLRHPPQGDTTGWYLWGGEEFPAGDDSFSPVHTKHLIQLQPNIPKFLGLPPGYRFLVAGDYLDVWYDATLLDI